jgi:hypothetical protein
LNNPIPLPEMLVERLGPEGKELLDLVQSMAISPEEGAERLVRLSVEDRRVLLEILTYLDGAHDVEEDHNRWHLEQGRMAKRVFARAAELEPTALAPDSTLREAVAVLRRHGEDLPPELDLERVIEVPAAEGE